MVYHGSIPILGPTRLCFRDLGTWKFKRVDDMMYYKFKRMDDMMYHKLWDSQSTNMSNVTSRIRKDVNFLKSITYRNLILTDLWCRSLLIFYLLLFSFSWLKCITIWTWVILSCFVNWKPSIVASYYFGLLEMNEVILFFAWIT